MSLFAGGISLRPSLTMLGGVTGDGQGGASVDFEGAVRATSVHCKGRREDGDACLPR